MTHSEDVVEKVAAAICDGDAKVTGVTWRVAPESAREQYRALARAALDAIDALYEDEVTL